MPDLAADIALLTDRRYEAPVAPEGDWYRANILSDDQLLQSALEKLGVNSVRVDWARPEVDWAAFRLAVFRTTWDYFDRFDEFSAWLRRVQTQTRLMNDASSIWWNLDKHYLADLATRGIPVVESHFLNAGSRVELHDLMRQFGWDEAVVKPCVSGAARHTYRVNRSNAADVDAVLRPLLAAESFLVQPFQRGILTAGEDALMVIDGRVTHGVRKIPKPGDFRVQDDHGGSAHRFEPTAEQVGLAERAIAACDPAPVYGRVDMVRDNRGELAVMELELIEPELWLRLHPPAATAFAEAIVRAITRGTS